MRSQTDDTPSHIVLENALMEILGYAALLEDMTFRSTPGGMDFTADGLCGLNRLAIHVRAQAAKALENLPSALEAHP